MSRQTRCGVAAREVAARRVAVAHGVAVVHGAVVDEVVARNLISFVEICLFNLRCASPLLPPSFAC